MDTELTAVSSCADLTMSATGRQPPRANRPQPLTNAITVRLVRVNFPFAWFHCIAGAVVPPVHTCPTRQHNNQKAAGQSQCSSGTEASNKTVSSKAIDY